MTSVLLSIFFLLTGCASIFGWDIHAPGVLSANFATAVKPIPARVALHLPQDVLNFVSKDRGGATADPQTYYVGEAFGPMMVEAFQAGFDEFVLMETEPTPAILKRYGISYLISIRIKEFDNRVTWGAHAIGLITEVIVLDQDFKMLGRFEASGASGAAKVFAKKGGPQVNLNAAIENNILAVMQYLQDSIAHNSWQIQNP